MTGPFVSVVVPVLNREADIGHCIEGLLKQDYPSYEVIIVDNNSNDNTRDVIRKYPVTLLVEERRNPYTSRNRGIAASRGDIVAFTDSDCVPDAQWLSKLVAAYDDDTIGGVGGSLFPLPASSVVEEFLSFGRLQIFSAKEKSIMEREPNRFLSGAMGSANMSYRRQVFEELGGFDDTFARFCGSYDFCWRVQEAGYRVVFEPTARVLHHMRKSVPEMCRQFFSFGIGQIDLLRHSGQRFSYLQLKLYIISPREVRFSLPFQAWVSLDAFHGAILAAVFALIWPVIWIPWVPLFLMVSTGAVLEARSVVKRTSSAKWYLLYPLFHILRIYALTAGRIAGGIRHRVLAI